MKMKTQIKLIPTLITATALMSCGGANTDATETTGTPYPLETCIVSGEKLGSMGDPAVIDHEGQQVKFCCEPCIDDFKKEPDKFLAKLKPESK